MLDPPIVLYEDAHCLAVAKPAGRLTQGIPGRESSVEDAVRQYLRPSDPAGVYLGTVHRLDRPVSGVLLWAKTPRATRRLAQQFAARAVRKEYWAVVEGRPDVDESTWEDRIGPVDPASGRAGLGTDANRGGRAALTRVRTTQGVRTPEGCSPLILSPETGRTHQLRVQASSRGLAIVGDRVYGSTLPFPVGIALHARSLVVEQPTTRQPLAISAPLPETWEGWWDGPS